MNIIFIPLLILIQDCIVLKLHILNSVTPVLNLAVNSPSLMANYSKRSKLN